MPLYEYECTACKNRFERSQKFSDPPVTECPECGGVVRRVIFPAGVVFKGSGWYITDSRGTASSNGSDAGAKADGKSDTKADAKAEGKADAKTETKSETKKTDTKTESSTPAKSESSSSAPTTK